MPSPVARSIIAQPGRFALDVLRGFIRNRGLLLSGSIAYYALLSIFPVLALALLILSAFVDEAQLFEALSNILSVTAIGNPEDLESHIRSFLGNREQIGIMGVISMLMFGSMAFSVIERSMRVIFADWSGDNERNRVVSILMPYAFILLSMAGFLIMALVTGWLHAYEQGVLDLMGMSVDLALTAHLGLLSAGFISEIVLFTAIYSLMPVSRIRWRHALVGGFVAATLWEITRNIMAWYLTTLSFVNVMYGSFASTIIVLLGFEFAAIILLFGAQVIAEYQRIDTQEND